MYNTFKLYMELADTKSKLKKAEKIIEFYSHRPEYNYTDIGGGEVKYGEILKDAGAKARAYLGDVNER